MEKNNLSDNYTQLLEKVDLMFHDIESRHPDKFSCARGCFGCCKPSLTVSHVEASRIRDWLIANPKTMEMIQSRADMLNDPNFCSMLNREGACAIYEARPLICRSHGLPVSWAEQDSAGVTKEYRDVCPLNFAGVSLDNLRQQDVLSLDKVNHRLPIERKAEA